MVQDPFYSSSEPGLYGLVDFSISYAVTDARSGMVVLLPRHGDRLGTEARTT